MLRSDDATRHALRANQKRGATGNFVLAQDTRAFDEAKDNGINALRGQLAEFGLVSPKGTGHVSELIA